MMILSQSSLIVKQSLGYIRGGSRSEEASRAASLAPSMQEIYTVSDRYSTSIRTPSHACISKGARGRASSLSSVTALISEYSILIYEPPLIYTRARVVIYSAVPLALLARRRNIDKKMTPVETSAIPSAASAPAAAASSENTPHETSAQRHKNTPALVAGIKKSRIPALST